MIAPALIKRATKSKIELSELPDEDPQDRFKAVYKTITLFGSEPKYLLDDMVAMIDLYENYKSFTFKIEDDNTVTIRVVNTAIMSKGLRARAAFDQVKKAWLESRQTLDIDDEEGDDEAEEEAEKEADLRGSVVRTKYRARYAEAGHAHTCGDWLATILNNYTTNKEGYNLELMEQVCELNGITDMGKYKREKASDRGRHKMTGRNRLAKLVFERGYLDMPNDQRYNAPQDWKDEYVRKTRRAAK